MVQGFFVILANTGSAIVASNKPCAQRWDITWRFGMLFLELEQIRFGVKMPEAESLFGQGVRAGPALPNFSW